MTVNISVLKSGGMRLCFQAFWSKLPRLSLRSCHPFESCLRPSVNPHIFSRHFLCNTLVCRSSPIFDTPCVEPWRHLTSTPLELTRLMGRESIPNALPSLHKYFLPAAVTLCLNTGLPIFPSVVANGFIIAFSQTSKTSPKNCRIASSVCGLVGLFGMLVLLDDEVPRLALLVEGGTEVYGVKGGKLLGMG